MPHTILADTVRRVLAAHTKAGTSVGICSTCYNDLKNALQQHEATPAPVSLPTSGAYVAVPKKEFDQLQEAKRFYLAHLDRKVIDRARYIPGVKNSYDYVPKPPAETLADEVRSTLPAIPRGSHQHAALSAALANYDATKNGDPPLATVLGSPPDPVMVARLLLDSLTGGSLSSLICAVHDELGSLEEWAKEFGPRGFLDNLKSNLRALGEKP